MQRFDLCTATKAAVLSAFVFGLNVTSANAAPSSDARGVSAEHARVVEHWTPARRAAALPRDLVLDMRGQGYMKQPDGTLIPYGRTVAHADGKPTPQAKPGGGTNSPSVISDLDPAGKQIGASYVFKATVTDDNGLRSVSFRLSKAGGAAQSFNASLTPGDVWTVSLSGFTDGNWSWTVVAKDKAGVTTTSSVAYFTVSTGSGGGGGSGEGVVVNEAWLQAGALQNAAGRIYFEMPSNARKTRWAGYVCSGTVVADGTTGRSVILTAAHCVYDDANKAFARNVLFIPNQDETTASGTDRTCGNDPLGCWSTWFGVVDVNWTTRSFPDNIPWDYAYYVVKDTGAHTPGILQNVTSVLDTEAPGLTIKFSLPSVNTGAITHGLGYSYSDDPNFMYCAEGMTTEGAYNWWLPSCGLSGGSSGGPWVQPMGTNGTGPVISVNSWGYTTAPGMAGPKLSGTSASCVFDKAKVEAPTSTADGDAGVAVTTC
jgi:hypothetical protein